MGIRQSKDQLLYQQVNYGNIEGIKSLHREGAGLEWIDNEGRTPLILACMRADLLPVAKTLIDLGANVNAYRPGKRRRRKTSGSLNGTPLHHAAKKGLDQTVNLLLTRGANPFLMNDDFQTALELATNKGHHGVVRIIESRICLFSGWLRELHGPSFLEPFAKKLVTRKIWAVVVPYDPRNPTNPSKFQLAIYPDLQTAKPAAVFSLWKVQIEEPKFNLADPSVTIMDKTKKCKLFSAEEGDKQQVQRFYNACKGMPQHVQALPASSPLSNKIPTRTETPGPLTSSSSSSKEDVELAMALSASIQSAMAEGVPLSDVQSSTHGASVSSGWGNPPPNTTHNDCGTEDGARPSNTSTQGAFNGWDVLPPSVRTDGWGSSDVSQDSKTSTYNGWDIPVPTAPEGSRTASTTTQEAASVRVPPPVAPPSAPPIAEEALYDGPIKYPPVESSPINVTASSSESKPESNGVKENNSSGSCAICLDAPVEGACIPCGHMAGCISCLNEIKGKGWGCPVCRTKIDQVVKIYTV